MTEPPPELIEQKRWETWLHHLGYILHRDHGWNRDTAAAYAWESQASWREYYDEGETPEAAARADQRAGLN